MRWIGQGVLPVIALIFGAPAEASAPERVHEYQVTHPTHGDIGAYVNTIRRDGDYVTVNTEIRIAVRILGVVAYRLEADRTEVWRDGRLIRYSGHTYDDGDETTVVGRAEEDAFIIDGPYGRTEAPADVYPTNPWSLGMIDATVVMATQTGALHQVQVTGGDEQMVDLGNDTIPARHFQVTGDVEHDVWYGRNDVVVRFTTVEEAGVITFTLR